MKKKNIFRVLGLVIIGFILIVLVDFVCSKYFKTRPLIAKK